MGICEGELTKSEPLSEINKFSSVPATLQALVLTGLEFIDQPWTDVDRQTTGLIATSQEAHTCT